MREIKFRAWDKKYKQMVSSLIINFNGSVYGRDISKEGCFYLRDLKEEYILMQFIGLKDKNGKEIFEGDIVLIPQKNRKEKVVIKDDGSWFVGGYYANKWEVIGNIYENPELLKEKGK